MPLYVVGSLSFFGKVVNATSMLVLHPPSLSTPYISAPNEEPENSLLNPFLNLLLNFPSLTMLDLDSCLTQLYY